jgi:hypothetical protein
VLIDKADEVFVKFTQDEGCDDKVEDDTNDKRESVIA